MIVHLNFLPYLQITQNLKSYVYSLWYAPSIILIMGM